MCGVVFSPQNLKQKVAGGHLTSSKADSTKDKCPKDNSLSTELNRDPCNLKHKKNSGFSLCCYCFQLPVLSRILKNRTNNERNFSFQLDLVKIFVCLFVHFLPVAAILQLTVSGSVTQRSHFQCICTAFCYL